MYSGLQPEYWKVNGKGFDGIYWLGVKRANFGLALASFIKTSLTPTLVNPNASATGGLDFVIRQKFV